MFQPLRLCFNPFNIVSTTATLLQPFQHWFNHFSTIVTLRAEWVDIISILDTVRKTGFDELDLVGGNLFILERSNKHLSIRHLRGVEESRNLTSSLKLRVNTFNHHMPWGYSSLFKNTNTQDRELEILDSYINNE
ncbi:uncharacterized protein LOC111700412 [Eurytemora carolleeae]|uniref:uncharacterized protein LOC111700412 n=1 Tax=Eurytemora carolleeae TaxID=1294199 RepID=UPI000C7895AE|nr:uncharacterized protein LOC111700412 [Eurytemora carolleeae]|eukprot:XP_023327067.1 uncharacterized protein LOC111700412 [Eurytemora affinis]